MRITDVAKLANVSKSTVSRVLSGHPYVSEAVRQRVLAAISEMNYRPSELARGLSRGSQHMWAVILPDIGNEFFARLVYGVERAAREIGFQVMIMSTYEDPEQVAVNLAAALSNRVSGIAIVPTGNDEALRHLFRHVRIPVVCLSRDTWSNEVDSVTFDNTQAAIMAIDYLVAHGHTEIAYLEGPESSKACRCRTNGFREGMARHGLQPNERLVGSGDLSYASGQAFAKQLLDRREAFTAVFASNDTMAMGVVDQLRTDGLRVPKDVSVIGLDDIFYSALPGINLTTIKQPPEEMGYQAAQLLQRRASGDASQTVHIAYSPELVERGTVTARPEEVHPVLMAGQPDLTLP